MKYYRLPLGEPPRQTLGRLVAAFARLPYENITKIIKRAECGSAENARRYPEEVICNHINWGAGGTCFSLTSALLYLVRSLGWKAEYILADRRYGQDTHCALLVWVDDIPHLLDPGFLIIDPIPLPAGGDSEIRTAFNSLILTPSLNGGEISLSTVRQGIKLYRLTYKTSPVDVGAFFKAWDASFDWDMMRYPLLTRAAESGQIYLKGSRLQINNANSVERMQISRDDLTARIASEFHIHPSVVARAISILRNRGEIIGKTSGR